MDAAKSTNLKARAGGIALAACGAFLLKIGFFDVLRDAEGGATHMMYLWLQSRLSELGFEWRLGAHGAG